MTPTTIRSRNLSPFTRRILACCVVALLAFSSSYRDASAQEDSPPIARWDFSTEENTKLELHGTIQRDQPGPRPPQFPDFDEGNTAVKLDGNGSYYAIPDNGPNSGFDFQQGDAITLEAWVKFVDFGSTENHYIVSKGRTGNPGFAANNQNWALRIRQLNGKGHLNFLFASAPEAGESKDTSHWHRWTSKNGFEAGSGWHHVAICYRFGEPDSIKGWVDGQLQEGTWDMGGKTTLAPMVDDDAIWIGSSQGGLPSNSFAGYLDAIAIHRQQLSDDVMKKRFNRVGPAIMAAKEVMPDLGELPDGKISTILYEAMPSHTRWLNEEESMPVESHRWNALDAFVLNQIPTKFDSWGIRDAWRVPLLMRMASDITLPAGKHKILMRVRGLSRLWIDGKLILRSTPLTGSPSGEEPITPLVEPIRTGARVPGYRQQEIVGDLEISQAGKHRIVLETMLGGKGHRPEPGELLVAIELDGTEQFAILQSSNEEPRLITDANIVAKLTEHDQLLKKSDDNNRRTAAAELNSHWEKRRQVARQWATEQLEKTNFLSRLSSRASSPIDRFLDEKIQTALAQASQSNEAATQHFHTKILPILKENCFRCHGDRILGGLELDSIEAIKLGGFSGETIIEPGKPEESELMRRILSHDESYRMPPTGDGLKAEQQEMLRSWIQAGAQWPAPPITPASVAKTDIIDDAAFLRRVSLDTIGLLPTEAELRSFLADTSSNKRSAAIDQLLSDDRWSDHWISYWQDVLAENPTLINASLNSTGPFRWFLHDALRDNKSLDRMVTELMMLRGNPHTGGSAGFGLAAENDAPFATKGQIVASAFLGMELQCARCHDSPYHSTTQKDLFALASMMERKSVSVPKSSMVPAAFFEKKNRESLIQATLKPNEIVQPQWPFAMETKCDDGAAIDALMLDPKDSRERLATLITAPMNERFAQVIVNRIWRRLTGAGLVEPPHDWEGASPSHPELLQWLALEFVAHDYQVKHIERLILNSEMYQRHATGNNRIADASVRFFNTPDRRRMTAEQVVDSLYWTAGVPMDLEELTFDPDGRRSADNRLTLGFAKRAWMFTSLANERDRPSLNLPKAHAVATVLEAFSWSGARQTPKTDRESEPNVLQPGVLANSILSTWLTRASHDSPLSQMAILATSPKELVDSLYLRYVSRFPTLEESQPLIEALSQGFEQRLVPADQITHPQPHPPIPRVTWSNHLMPEATTIQLEMERRARLGPPVDGRLDPAWREIYEDVIWSLVNTREFVWIP